MTTAREIASAAAARGLPMLDAPVSGGVGGTQGATLTFMVGGPDEAFTQARPYLEAMGKTIVHAGGAGNGQLSEGEIDELHVGLKGTMNALFLKDLAIDGTL